MYYTIKHAEECFQSMYWFSILDFISVRVRAPASINFSCSWTTKWAPLNLTAGCNPEFDWRALQGEGGRNIPPINEPC